MAKKLEKLLKQEALRELKTKQKAVDELKVKADPRAPNFQRPLVPVSKIIKASKEKKIGLYGLI